MLGSTRSRVSRLRPEISARTRILGFFLLLVSLSLATATFVTWRLLVQATDNRIDASLQAEVDEFTTLTGAGVNPQTGESFTAVRDVLTFAITYNAARPNEVFLGYVDGEFAVRSRAIQATVVLNRDEVFNALVGQPEQSQSGRYASGAGEVRYVSIPITLIGDPHRGTLVIAYFRDQEAREANDAARLLLLVGGATLVVAGVAAWIIAGRVLRPVRDIARTAQSISDSDLSRRIPAQGNDELARLARTFNGMLDRLEHAFSTQRRFVDDAGHELRTPITIIRGHLEVLDPNDPQDRTQTLALVNDELDRMARMVNDLLLLAKSEQPQFLRAANTDLATLTRDIFDKASALADRRWLLDAVADGGVTVDPQRITQAIIQLAQNATQHTQSDDRIAIGSSVTIDEARIWVSDTGSGIAAADQERVFQRFARADASARRSDGAGLGLAIVVAIAEAHQGRVTLDSSIGQGATFTLVLPRLPLGMATTDDGQRQRETELR